MLASCAPYLAVIDGDLQHDERLLAEMLKTLKCEKLDLVIGSRYVSGGGIGAWDRNRAAMSSFATRLARLVVREPPIRPDERVFHHYAPGIRTDGTAPVGSGI